MFRLERACQVQVAALSCNVELRCRRRRSSRSPTGMYHPSRAPPLRPARVAGAAAQARPIDPSYRD